MKLYPFSSCSGRQQFCGSSPQLTVTDELVCFALSRLRWHRLCAFMSMCHTSIYSVRFPLQHAEVSDFGAQEVFASPMHSLDWLLSLVKRNFAVRCMCTKHTAR